MGKGGPNATFNLMFLGLGWPWVGEFVGLMYSNIYIFSNPTELGKSQTPINHCTPKLPTINHCTPKLPTINHWIPKLPNHQPAVPHVFFGHKLLGINVSSSLQVVKRVERHVFFNVVLFLIWKVLPLSPIAARLIPHSPIEARLIPYPLSNHASSPISYRLMPHPPIPYRSTPHPLSPIAAHLKQKEWWSRCRQRKKKGRPTDWQINLHEPKRSVQKSDQAKQTWKRRCKKCKNKLTSKHPTLNSKQPEKNNKNRNQTKPNDQQPNQPKTWKKHTHKHTQNAEINQPNNVPNETKTAQPLASTRTLPSKLRNPIDS